MDRYDIKEELGEGTFGTVFRAVNKTTGNVVAIKRMKRESKTWKETVELRELKCLMSLSSHQNIVQLQEVIRESDMSLHFVFEFMKDGNLYELIRNCVSFKLTHKCRSTCTPNLLTHDRIRSIIHQVFLGLEHLHERGHIHRDIKPENLLLCGDVCKVADFGLAKETSSPGRFTDYVSTRWYRAPEVLLRSPRYGQTVDLFAVGCILAELYTFVPLFPGKDEIDQLHQFIRVLGPPSMHTWPEGVHLMKNRNIHISERTAKWRGPLETLVPQAPLAAIALIRDLLQYNPTMRSSARKALTHEYFSMKHTPIMEAHSEWKSGQRPHPVSISPRAKGGINSLRQPCFIQDQNQNARRVQPICNIVLESQVKHKDPQKFLTCNRSPAAGKFMQNPYLKKR